MLVKLENYSICVLGILLLYPELLKKLKKSVFAKMIIHILLIFFLSEMALTNYCVTPVLIITQNDRCIRLDQFFWWYWRTAVQLEKSLKSALPVIVQIIEPLLRDDGAHGRTVAREDAVALAFIRFCPLRTNVFLNAVS